MIVKYLALRLCKENGLLGIEQNIIYMPFVTEIRIYRVLIVLFVRDNLCAVILKQVALNNFNINIKGKPGKVKC